jgi:CHAT domain-containing protein/tetratricopeptide (TPR) repeat protein
VCESFFADKAIPISASFEQAGVHVNKSGEVTPRGRGPELAKASAGPLPWLRKLSLHLWAYWTSLVSEAAFLVRLSKSGNTSERASAVEALARTKLDVGAALDQGPPAGRIGVLRSIGLNLRSFHYDRIVGPLLALPDDLRAALSRDDLARVIHFAELSLAYCEAGTARAFTKPRTGPSRIRALQRLCLGRALHHMMLAHAYVRLEVGDLAQNLESAFEHYRSAAIILEQEAPLALSLYAANAWSTLATAQLSYPTENRAHYARQAIEAFSTAKKIVAPRAAGIEAPPEVMTDQKVWEKLPYLARVRYAAQYAVRLQRSRWKVVRTGVPEPLMSGMMVPFFAAKIDWQLGIAYRELGQLEKAVEHFTLALGGFAQGGEYFRAGVETDTGYAYLEAQTGDRKKNLALAAQSFQDASTACVEKGFVKKGVEKSYALALVGDARVYFEQESLKLITSEHRAKSLPLLVNELRTAAGISRKIPARPLLSEALFLLGKAYGLQRNTAKQYCALALAARVGDSLAARARTPRLSRYLVGMQAPLYDLLTVAAFECGSPQRKDAGPKAKPVDLGRVFSFAERGRTVFLRSHLESISLLPRGAAPEELRRFFAQRRVWHEAEIRLLEYESARRADVTVLREIQEHRDRCASRYRAELEQVRAKFNDAAYDPDKPIMSVPFADLYPALSQYLETERAALVEYCLTSRGLLVFVWLPTKLTATYIGISVAELKRIEARWWEGSAVLRETNNVAYWEGGYLGQVLDRLRRAVELPVEIIRNWEAQTGRRVERVMIVPHRFLHHVPLHAITQGGGVPWGDSVVIHYVPSASLLSQLLRARDGQRGEPVLRPDHREGRAAVSIGYPGEPPLLFCRAEAQAVAAATGGQVLLGRDATPARVKDAIRDAAYIHFSCHGVFNSEMPLDAGLVLAPDTLASGAAPESPREPQDGPAHPESGRLTLGEILRDVSLSRARLVVLSACETGLTKVEERHEEYLGLPAGFLYAGATTVVSSLWKVDDVATWLLMRAFVRELAAGAATWVALRKAQQELRGLSGEYVLQQVESAAEQEDDPVRREAMLCAGRALRQVGPFPFAGPYWWAGFTVNGL